MAAHSENRLPPDIDLVFLHGVNNTPAVWAPVRSHLAPWRSRAVALPACDEMATLAEEILVDLPRTFVLVGHSLGGYVALEIIRQDHNRVAGIALVDSLDLEDSPVARQRRAESASRAEAGEYQQLAEAATRVSYHQHNLDDLRLMAERAAAVKGYGPGNFAAHQRAAAGRVNQRAILGSFAGPALVVAGEDDRVIPAAAQEEMATAVGAHFEIIPGAGHMLPAEQPERLGQVLASWLDGHITDR